MVGVEVCKVGDMQYCAVFREVNADIRKELC